MSFFGPSAPPLGYCPSSLAAAEVDAIKATKPRGLKILEFHPISDLRPENLMTQPRFLYPNEKDVKGSNKAFVALYHALSTQNKLALCREVANKRSAPRRVALVPQPEVVDEDGMLLEPAGLLVYVLPFLDDVRHPETDPKLLMRGGLHNDPDVQITRADDVHIAAAFKLVEDTTLDYGEFSLAKIHNPAVERHFRAIESISLCDPPPTKESIIDETLPPVLPKLRDPNNTTIQEFKDYVFDGTDGGPPVGGGGGARATANAAIAAHGLVCFENFNFLELAQQSARGGQGLSGLTVEQLKFYLIKHNLKKTGNKGDLISRILQHSQGDV
ncbi:MAG: hypothetical protein WDW38_005736 [Sanguina aurantia]